ncbi:MAG: SDR family NAD(P)-dependent oxidoreductase [Lachnospiraceae bacterium]|uniref:SDR family NAD(P)-dependent oxidoreductase n=1 Tax=Candidatus Weimeria bifida TaxID=2599074 RepID=A0A6N7IWT4_9FIRM|nr:SDR family NAD(P)-dependent oxidoreductase [Candidatus Weimeria bifida]RRF95779.1 MAG: SDR family NAD(P)-dependent oxidoreductase [Lachnospiraceae bacterium]
MFDYSKKVVAVTGASSGLGKQVAEGYAKAGADLVILARRIERLDQSAKYMEEKISSGKQSYGRIINIASIYGIVGNTAIPTIAYHASKGAVVNFTRAAAEKSFHFLRRSSRPFSIVLLSLYRDIRADFYRICLLLF